MLVRRGALSSHRPGDASQCHGWGHSLILSSKSARCVPYDPAGPASHLNSGEREESKDNAGRREKLFTAAAPSSHKEKGQTSGGHKTLDLPVRTASPFLKTKRLKTRFSWWAFLRCDPGHAAGRWVPFEHVTAAAHRPSVSSAATRGRTPWALTSYAS